MTFTEQISKEELRYLKLLSRSFPDIGSASTEIINLEAILNLPKGTEHFLTDLHGEFEAFQHVLKNASGNVKNKVNEKFGNMLRESEKRELSTLIYYPHRKLALVKSQEKDLKEWYMITLIQLVKVCQTVSSKYTRSKVRKALPQEFSYIIEEMMHESENDPNKHAYISMILKSIIAVDRADEFIIALCHTIQRLVIDSLHIVGDIYDRGPGAHIIMDTLINYHKVDIQWGNHDILWMGAAAGNPCCVANVLRISLRYANLTTLEDGYGINLLPLATLAMETYADDPCEFFQPRLKFADHNYDAKNIRMIAQMQKMIAIIQFKQEAQIIKRHPEYAMDNRNLLHCIDYEKGTISIAGKEYPMKDMYFPTIDPKDPYKLTLEEQELIDKMTASFRNSEKLQKHMDFLLSHGSMYLCINNNLLFHASVPVNEDGSLKEVDINGEKLHGKALYDRIDFLIRKAFDKHEEVTLRQYAIDYIWYLWCGPDAPPFDKSQMTTFERYFIEDKETWVEKKGCYFSLRDEEFVIDSIMDEFGVKGSHRHIINGHVPVKRKKGESPIRANGKLMVIDGGFSRAYQPETGIAGYTLIFNSHGMQLVQHEPFTSARDAVLNGSDIKSQNFIVDFDTNRMMVRDTDNGKVLEQQVKDLKKLLAAYRSGLIFENTNY